MRNILTGGTTRLPTPSEQFESPSKEPGRKSVVKCYTPDLKMQRVVGFTTEEASPVETREHCCFCDQSGGHHRRALSDGGYEGFSPVVERVNVSPRSPEEGEMFSAFAEAAGSTSPVNVQDSLTGGHDMPPKSCASLERASSRLTAELQAKTNFDSRMSKLKSLSLRRIAVTAEDNDMARTMSCHGMDGERRLPSSAVIVPSAEKKEKRRKQNLQRRSLVAPDSPNTDSSAGSSCSEALPIPRISRAYTTPDPLPELSASLIESIMLESRRREESPKSASHTTTPSGHDRRRHLGRRVPSNVFMENMARVKEIQDNVFTNTSRLGERGTSSFRHRLSPPS
jgi:hypothetical protein